MQNPVYYRKFRHILAYSEHCVTLAYWEPRAFLWWGDWVEISVTMRRQIEKQVLAIKHPKAVQKKKKKFGLKYKWFKMSYLEWTSSVNIITSSELFFSFRFSRRKSQSQQKTNEKYHLTYNTALLKKISLILQTSTHSTLKNPCFRNTAKNLSHFRNFPANIWLVLEKTLALHHF